MAQQVEARRRQKQARVIAFLHFQSALAPGLLSEKATDILWTLTSYELYRMLVVAQGWKPEQYERWLGQLLIQQLLASS